MATVSLSFAFSYGLVGGPLHARRFKKLMQKAGFVHTKYTQKADIIIAHSAGCWLIPPDSTPKLVIYVGMPLAQRQPLQTLRAANQAKLNHNDFRQGFIKRSKSTFYGIIQPRRNLKIIKMSKLAEPVIFDKAPVVFIANSDDPWPDDTKLEHYMLTHPWAFMGLVGAHDDVWLNSEKYVEIIEKYAGLLA